MKITWLCNLGHTFVKLAQIGLGLLHYFILTTHFFSHSLNCYFFIIFIIFNFQNWIVEDWVLFFLCDYPHPMTKSRVWDVSLGWHLSSSLNFFYTCFLSLFQSLMLRLLNIEFFFICFLYAFDKDFSISRPKSQVFYANSDWIGAFIFHFIISFRLCFLAFRSITWVTWFCFTLTYFGIALTPFF